MNSTGHSAWRPWPVLLAVLLLTSCASQSVRNRQAVDDMRRQADNQGILQVYTVGNPEAADLIERAREAEAGQDVVTALAMTREALEIEPNDPEYWQYLAELQLLQKDYARARRSAQQSYAMGPQVGQLCYRNWLIIQRAEQALGNGAAAGIAAQRAERCTLKEAQTF